MGTVYSGAFTRTRVEQIGEDDLVFDMPLEPPPVVLAGRLTKRLGISTSFSGGGVDLAESLSQPIRRTGLGARWKMLDPRLLLSLLLWAVGSRVKQVLVFMTCGFLASYSRFPEYAWWFYAAAALALALKVWPLVFRQRLHLHGSAYTITRKTPFGSSTRASGKLGVNTHFGLESMGIRGRAELMEVDTTPVVLQIDGHLAGAGVPSNEAELIAGECVRRGEQASAPEVELDFGQDVDEDAEHDLAQATRPR